MHAVIVTGWRYYPYRHIVEAQLSRRYILYGMFHLFHGACRDKKTGEMIGADRYADDWAKLKVHGIEVTPMEADWDQHGNAAGPIRNHEMVKKAVSLYRPQDIHGLAFPGPTSRGTYNCIVEMKRFGIRDIDTWDTGRARQWLNDIGKQA